MTVNLFFSKVIFQYGRKESSY